MYFYIIVIFSIDIYSKVNKFYSIISFSLLINTVILLLNRLLLILYLYIHFLSPRHYFLQFNCYLDLYITDIALKVSQERIHQSKAGAYIRHTIIKGVGGMPPGKKINFW